MREKIRKAIQYFLSAVVLWEVTTATGNSFHNLFPKTAFRILFKIWLWIYGFIIFTKYKATSLLCSWLQIKCFSSPETSHLKEAVANPGNSVPPDALASSHVRKILPLLCTPTQASPLSAIKSSTVFLWLSCLCSAPRERRGHQLYRLLKLFPLLRAITPLPLLPPPAQRLF